MQVLHQNATPAARQFTRVYVWLLWLVALLVLPLSDIGILPFETHLSVGLFARLPLVMQEILLTPIALRIMHLAAMVLIGCTLIQPRRVVWPALACILLTIIQCQLRGFGHVNHAEIVLLLSAYAITWFDLVDWHRERMITQGLEIQPVRPGAPLVAIVFALTFTYSLTGLSRLGNGGMEIFQSGSLSTWCQLANFEARYFDLSFGTSLLSVPAFAWTLEAGYPLITVMEILAPLCLFSKWFRRFFLVTMAPFHLLTVLLMSILFWENLALYILLFDISRWLPDTESVQQDSIPDRRLATAITEPQPQ